MEVVTNGRRFTAPSGVLARIAVTSMLVAAAMAALAITDLIRSNGRASAQAATVIQAAPSSLTIPLTAPSYSGEVGPFAFGYLEFDQNPANGVPGFSSWPPGSQRR